MSDEKSGFYKTLEMLRGLDPEHQARLLKTVAEQDPQLAEKLSSNLFQFEDLAGLSPKALGEIIKAVPERTLALCLRKCPEAVQSALFSAMSARAAQMLKETAQSIGPQPLSKVTTAQQDVLEKAKELEAAGVILLKISDDDPMV